LTGNVIKRQKKKRKMAEKWPKKKAVKQKRDEAPISMDYTAPFAQKKRSKNGT
jgi:hypothetical protein